jgi:hypothetical protein
MRWTTTLTLLTSFLLCTGAFAEEAPGQVRLPLELYNQLMASVWGGEDPARDPIRFALGTAVVSVRVASTEPRAVSQVSVSLPIEIFEEGRTLVPVLPPGSAVLRAAVQGNAVPLVSTPNGLAFSASAKGSLVMELSYQVDAISTERGFVLTVPVPPAPAIQLSAALPGSGLDVSVLPAAGVRTTTSGAQTTVQATVPSTSGVQISWRGLSGRAPAVSRATYRGELASGAVRWRAELKVELFSGEAVTVPLLPRSVTLTSLTLDGSEAPILVERKQFATLVRGQGTHTIVASFETPVVQENGPPRTVLNVPEVPVSRVDLTLPGRKEVSATPAASVSTRTRGGATEATVHVPLTESVTLSWSEAVPEAAARELRASASIYHVIQAEEGVLTVKAHVVYEVQHGATNRIELALPDGVEVNAVTSPAGAVADWRVERGRARRVLRIFLDRELASDLALLVEYDRSLGATGEGQALPLLEALEVGRQRGMVALVQTRDVALNPVDDGGAARVGENQLPSAVRDAIERTIAHTLKYSEQLPAIRVDAVAPERAAGRFDASVDTLLSLGEVALVSTTSIDVHVKSGGIDRIDLALPPGANLLNLVAPSLRTHRLTDSVVEVEFTQEMEGDFRIELSYERLLGEDETRIDAASVRVRGADVEQGRIAIEASSAVEVAPLETVELSPLDVLELPRQLVLRTTHPILHAFRYVRAEPEPRLSLVVTRHPSVAVQEAVIDRAEHRTLFTRDGLAVTTTKLFVRNTRKQFLRIRLPEESEIWSVFVSGKPEKPAVDGASEDGRFYLIKIVSSTDGFPVELVYATKVPSFGAFGSVRARLPRPDFLVTETKWDLFVPEGFQYCRPSTNMELVVDGIGVSRDELASQLGPDFRIHVPSAGRGYAFEMLYANHGDVDAWVSLPYRTRLGTALGQILSLAGTFLLFLVVRTRMPRTLALASAGVGLLLLLVPIAVYGVGALPALVLAGALGLKERWHELRRLVETLRRPKATENESTV